MALYTFQTDLLSAQKTGIPNLTNTNLSATGVTFLSGANVFLTSKEIGVVSLSTTDVGLSYTPVDFVVTTPSFTPTAYPTITVDILGSVFNIPASLHNTEMAIVNNDNTFSVFTFLSSITIVQPSAITETRNVSTADARRKRMLGY